MIDVKSIAQLARLGLDKKEEKKLAKELSEILNFVNKLEEVKADKAEPTAQVTGLENVARKDRGAKKSSQETEKLMSLAPQKEKGYVKVKAIL